ncbi:hypothetical protein P5V15_011128 [Pogonomyrmex californicus]
MTAIIKQLIAWYKFINEDLADPRTKDYFMISSPWPGLTLIGLYLYFIYSFGPRFMKKRQPFKLNRILQIYNIIQILLNGLLFYIAFADGLKDFNYICEPSDFSYTLKAIKITKLVWFYFLIKMLDLMDTIFFVLRKKQKQVTFLHLYHHVGILIGAWGATKYLPSGHIIFLGILNTVVHVIMYMYYLLSSMKINTNAWKKYITQLQLIQFFIITLHDLQLFWLKDCDFPLWPMYIMVPQNLFMMILFGDFYYKTYIKKKSVKKAVLRKTEINGISSEVTTEKQKEQ